MPIAINGSGTITGISAGGLPDGVITTDDIAAGAVTDAKVNASAAIADSKLSGTTCKAWVNFNGTGTVAITASYNVSSITDNGVGQYTINFTNAFSDSKYCAVGMVKDEGGQNIRIAGGGSTVYTTTALKVQTTNAANASYGDSDVVNVAIFR